MGRKKLCIGLRENLSQRKSTFQKRQAGLIKKISELSTVCGIDAGIVIISANGEPTVYSSGDRFEDIVDLLKQISPAKRNVWTGAQYPEEEMPKTKKKVSKKRKKRPALSDDEDSSSEGPIETPHWTPEDTDWDCDLTFLDPPEAAPAAAVNVKEALPSVVHQFANAFDDLTDPGWTPEAGVLFSEAIEAALNETEALRIPSTEQFANAFNDLPLPSIDQLANEFDDLTDPGWTPEAGVLFSEAMEAALNEKEALPSTEQFANAFNDLPLPSIDQLANEFDDLTDPGWTPEAGVLFSEAMEAALNETEALSSTEQFANAFNDLPLPSIDQLANEFEDLTDPDWPPETDVLFPEPLEAAVNVTQALPSISHQFANGFINFPRPHPDWTPNIDNDWHRDQIYEGIAVNVTDMCSTPTI